MVPAIVKIRKRDEFQEVFKNSRRLFSPYFSLYYRWNELNQCRFGSIASKSNLATAVLRNRVKRIIRERIRLNQDRLRGADLVIVVKKTAKEAESKELHQCLEELLTRLLQHPKKS